MKINCEHIFFSSSSEETIELGRYFGLRLIPGVSVLLSGELGSGKTTFVKGLADGLDVPDAEYVNSPTYNLINEYIGRYVVNHIDLYRLNSPMKFEEIGLREIFDFEGISIVEWPEKLMPKDFPKKRLNVDFDVLGEFERHITITTCGISFDLKLL